VKSSSLVRFWLSDTGSRLGFQVVEFLLPVTAVVVVHATSTDVGLVTAVQFLPVLFFSLTAGSLVARYSPTSLLLVSNLGRLLAAGYLAASAIAGRLSLTGLMAAGFVVGTATIVYDVTFQTAVPRVIDQERLRSVNGILQASVAVVQLAAPALAGFLVGWIRASGSFLAASGLFLLVTLGFAVRITITTSTDGESADRPSVIQGLKYTWQDRYIRAICIQSGVYNLHEQAFLTVFLVYGLKSASLTSAQIGFTVGAASAGSLLGALAAGRLTRRLHFGRLLTWSLPFAAAPLLIASCLPGRLSILAFVVAFFANGVGLGLYNVNAVSLRQIAPPARFLGSVTAACRMLSFGTIPLGALLGGLLLAHLGGRVALIAISASLVLLTLQMLFTPARSLSSIEGFRSLEPARRG
jgi:MFS family permease